MVLPMEGENASPEVLEAVTRRIVGDLAPDGFLDAESFSMIKTMASNPQQELDVSLCLTNNLRMPQWRPVLRTLLVLHRLIRDLGGNFLTSFAAFLDHSMISHVPDSPGFLDHSSGPGTAWVRTYGRYLHLRIEAHREPARYNPSGPPKPGAFRGSTIAELLKIMPRVTRALLAITSLPLGDLDLSECGSLAATALSLCLQDSFRAVEDVADGLAQLTERVFDLESGGQKARVALRLIEDAAATLDRASGFYRRCQEISPGSKFPDIKIPTAALMKRIQEWAEGPVNDPGASAANRGAARSLAGAMGSNGALDPHYPDPTSTFQNTHKGKESVRPPLLNLDLGDAPVVIIPQPLVPYGKPLDAEPSSEEPWPVFPPFVPPTAPPQAADPPAIDLNPGAAYPAAVTAPLMPPVPIAGPRYSGPQHSSLSYGSSESSFAPDQDIGLMLPVFGTVKKGPDGQAQAPSHRMGPGPAVTAVNGSFGSTVSSLGGPEASLTHLSGLGGSYQSHGTGTGGLGGGGGPLPSESISSSVMYDSVRSRPLAVAASMAKSPKKSLQAQAQAQPQLQPLGQPQSPRPNITPAPHLESSPLVKAGHGAAVLANPFGSPGTPNGKNRDRDRSSPLKAKPGSAVQPPGSLAQAHAAASARTPTPERSKSPLATAPLARHFLKREERTKSPSPRGPPYQSPRSVQSGAPAASPREPSIPWSPGAFPRSHAQRAHSPNPLGPPAAPFTAQLQPVDPAPILAPGYMVPGLMPALPTPGNGLPPLVHCDTLRVTSSRDQPMMAVATPIYPSGSSGLPSPLGSPAQTGSGGASSRSRSGTSTPQPLGLGHLHESAARYATGAELSPNGSLRPRHGRCAGAEWASGEQAFDNTVNGARGLPPLQNSDTIDPSLLGSQNFGPHLGLAASQDMNGSLKYVSPQGIDMSVRSSAQFGRRAQIAHAGGGGKGGIPGLGSLDIGAALGNGPSAAGGAEGGYEPKQDSPGLHDGHAFGDDTSPNGGPREAPLWGSGSSNDRASPSLSLRHTPPPPGGAPALNHVHPDPASLGHEGPTAEDVIPGVYAVPQPTPKAGRGMSPAPPEARVYHPSERVYAPDDRVYDLSRQASGRVYSVVPRVYAHGAGNENITGLERGPSLPMTHHAPGFNRTASGAAGAAAAAAAAAAKDPRAYPRAAVTTESLYPEGDSRNSKSSRRSTSGSGAPPAASGSGGAPKLVPSQASQGQSRPVPPQPQQQPQPANDGVRVSSMPQKAPTATAAPKPQESQGYKPSPPPPSGAARTSPVPPSTPSAGRRANDAAPAYGGPGWPAPPPAGASRSSPPSESRLPPSTPKAPPANGTFVPGNQPPGPVPKVFRGAAPLAGLGTPSPPPSRTSPPLPPGGRHGGPHLDPMAPTPRQGSVMGRENGSFSVHSSPGGPRPQGPMDARGVKSEYNSPAKPGLAPPTGPASMTQPPMQAADSEGKGGGLFGFFKKKSEHSRNASPLPNRSPTRDFDDALPGSYRPPPASAAASVPTQHGHHGSVPRPPPASASATAPATKPPKKLSAEERKRQEAEAKQRDEEARRLEEARRKQEDSNRRKTAEERIRDEARTLGLDQSQFPTMEALSRAVRQVHSLASQLGGKDAALMAHRVEEIRSMRAKGATAFLHYVREKFPPKDGKPPVIDIPEAGQAGAPDVPRIRRGLKLSLVSYHPDRNMRHRDENWTRICNEITMCLNQLSAALPTS